MRPPSGIRSAILLGASLLAAACGDGSGPTPTPEPQSGPVLPVPAPAARLELPLGGKPEGVLFQDLDLDGRDELIAVTHSPAALWVWRTPPSGWQLAPAPRSTPLAGYPLGPVGTPLASWAAVASRAQPAIVATDPRSEATGQPAQLPLPSAPRALAAGDVDGDGSPEIVIVDTDGGLVLWAPTGPHAPAGTRIELGEDQACCLAVLRDGRVAVGFQGSRSVRVLEPMNGASQTLQLDGIPRAIAEVEVGGAQRLAIAGGDRSLWLFERSEGGMYRPLSELETGAIPLRLEPTRAGAGLLVLEYDALALRVLGPAGLAGGAPEHVLYAGQTPWDLAGGDWNGDGFDDVAFANRDARRISVLFGAPDGGLRSAPRTPTGRAPHSLAAGDLDGDGLPEVAAVDSLAATITLLRNEGGALAKGASLSAGEGADHARIADLDGDGAMDLSWTARGAGGARLVAAFGHGDGSLAAPVALSAPALARSAADLLFADLDGDGQLEAWIADRDGGQVVGLRLAAGADARLVATELARLPLEGGPRALALVTLPDGPRLAVGAGDGRGPSGMVICRFRDGRLELEQTLATGLEPLSLDAGQAGGVPELALLGRADAGVTSGELRVFRCDSGGAWAQSARLATGQRPFAARLGDLDGDGHDDLVTSAQNSHHTNLWLARGEAFQPACDLGTGTGPLDLLLVDLDGDGALELVVANAFSDDVSVVRFR